MASKRSLQGIVQHYDPHRGLGEIQTEDGKTFSVHRNELRDDALSGIFPGDIVQFVAGRNRFGHQAAWAGTRRGTRTPSRVSGRSRAGRGASPGGPTSPCRLP